MIPVYQSHTVVNNGYENCFNACVASILELTLNVTPQIFPGDPGNWSERWRVALGTLRYKLTHTASERPPSGYSIAIVTTDRIYPDDHPKSGNKIIHAIVAFDGVLIHDPFPLGSTGVEIIRYDKLDPLSDTERLLHEMRLKQGVCKHGYFMNCEDCEHPL